MKPDCYKCIHRRSIPGDAHTKCNNFDAKTKGHLHGVKNGWFMWPLNFDPTWLISCDGFSDKKEDDKTESEADPFTELMALLR